MNEVLTKVCFKCNEQKPITEFYKHKQMSSGVVNKCKECNKNDVRKDYYRKSENEEWVLKERERGREKYKRLGYNKKQKIWDEKRPYTKSSKYKGLNRKLKTEKGIELHHWNYSDEFIEDVFFLKVLEHRKAHKFLIKKGLYIFSDLDGNILDTRKKHFEYLLSKGINF